MPPAQQPEIVQWTVIKLAHARLQQGKNTIDVLAATPQLANLNIRRDDIVQILRSAKEFSLSEDEQSFSLTVTSDDEDEQHNSRLLRKSGRHRQPSTARNHIVRCSRTIYVGNLNVRAAAPPSSLRAAEDGNTQAATVAGDAQPQSATTGLHLNGASLDSVSPSSPGESILNITDDHTQHYEAAANISTSTAETQPKPSECSSSPPPRVWQSLMEELLYELFIQVGPIEDLVVPIDKEGNMRGFAFINFVDPASVRYASQVLSGVMFLGMPLRVRLADNPGPDPHAPKHADELASSSQQGLPTTTALASSSQQTALASSSQQGLAMPTPLAAAQGSSPLVPNATAAWPLQAFSQQHVSALSPAGLDNSTTRSLASYQHHMSSPLLQHPYYTVQPSAGSGAGHTTPTYQRQGSGIQWPYTAVQQSPQEAWHAYTHSTSPSLQQHQHQHQQHFRQQYQPGILSASYPHEQAYQPSANPASYYTQTQMAYSQPGARASWPWPGNQT